MSICRWSSDDFRSDIYAYQTREGYEVMVASMKQVFVEPMPPPADSGDFDAMMDRWREVGQIADRSELIPIGLPSDGKTFRVDDADDCLELLVCLQEEGYHVPKCAFQSLREELRKEA